MIKVASYNIHRGIGLDRRRNPERIMACLREIDADIIALQEVDRRFGRRESALPLHLIDESPWKAVPLDTRPDSIGWHGNALLVRKGIAVESAAIVPLPTLEPRGAISADICAGAIRLRVVAMHLDLSGIRRRGQVRTIVDHARKSPPTLPLVMMGDLNDWAEHSSALRQFDGDLHVLRPGNSFHSRRPIAALDRIIVSGRIGIEGCGVHHSALSARASDHLPVWAKLAL
ncbi:MAG: endonuclease/exonuclease/phosphatase family protein [Sphingopyxis sp.]